MAPRPGGEGDYLKPLRHVPFVVGSSCNAFGKIQADSFELHVISNWLGQVRLNYILWNSADRAAKRLCR